MSVRDFDLGCEKCPRLSEHLRTIRHDRPGYHARPVPPFGAENPRILVVGLGPGMHGANRTGRPFTGDYAGILLYQTLHHFGFANLPQSLAADDDLRLTELRITNAVKCLPPANKPTTAEINTCNAFLATEIENLPRNTILFALGLVAHGAILRALGLRKSAFKFGHGAEHHLPDGRALIDSYHCSRYNTQTKRLTEEMFRAAFARAVALANGRGAISRAASRGRAAK